MEVHQGNTINFSEERRHRGLTLASLAVRDGGWGLTRLTVVAAPAFLATLTAASQNANFRQVRHWLAPDAIEAYKRVRGDLSPTGWHYAARVLPPRAELVVEGDFALNLSSNNAGNPSPTATARSQE